MGEELLPPAVTLLILTVPWLLILFVTLFYFVWIGLDSVLFLGAGVTSLPLLTQPLVFVVEGAARFAELA